MKLRVAVCFSVVALTFSGGAFSVKCFAQEAKPAPNAKTEAPENALTAIPSNAVQIDPGVYQWTDAKGKKWILYQTPFGIARKEDTGAPLRKKQRDVETMQGVKIIEDGDSLKFEREGPFGTYKWTKKKSDLTDSEKTAWEQEKAGIPVGSKPASDKATSDKAANDKASSAKATSSKQDR